MTVNLISVQLSVLHHPHRIIVPARIMFLVKQTRFEGVIMKSSELCKIVNTNTSALAKLFFWLIVLDRWMYLLICISNNELLFLKYHWEWTIHPFLLNLTVLVFLLFIFWIRKARSGCLPWSTIYINCLILNPIRHLATDSSIKTSVSNILDDFLFIPIVNQFIRNFVKIRCLVPYLNLGKLWIIEFFS